MDDNISIILVEVPETKSSHLDQDNICEKWFCIAGQQSYPPSADPLSTGRKLMF